MRAWFCEEGAMLLELAYRFVSCKLADRVGFQLDADWVWVFWCRLENLLPIRHRPGILLPTGHRPGILLPTEYRPGILLPTGYRPGILLPIRCRLGVDWILVANRAFCCWLSVSSTWGSTRCRLHKSRLDGRAPLLPPFESGSAEIWCLLRINLALRKFGTDWVRIWHSHGLVSTWWKSFVLLVVFILIVSLLCLGERNLFWWAPLWPLSGTGYVCATFYCWLRLLSSQDDSFVFSSVLM